MHYIIAHRGGADEALENTVGAFTHSVQNNVDMIETDVRSSKDGKVYICHDEDFGRLFKNDTITHGQTKM